MKSAGQGCGLHASADGLFEWQLKPQDSKLIVKGVNKLAGACSHIDLTYFEHIASKTRISPIEANTSGIFIHTINFLPEYIDYIFESMRKSNRTS